MSQYFSNNTNSLNTVNVLNNITITNDRSSVLAWLSPLNPKLRHQDIRDSRVENIGEWLLQTEEFRGWYTGSGGGESSNAVLFCCGDPGAGKTYISSLVIDRLCDQTRGQNVAVVCFYFDFAAQKEQSSTNMLGALLKQVVNGMEKVPEEISKAYEDQKNAIGGRGPGLPDIVKMLQTTSSEKPTLICIDALDECAAGDRVRVLDSLKKILQKSPGTRVFVTGRSHIQAEIGKRLSGKVRSISITPRRDDIISYLRTKLDEDTTPDAMDDSLEADILKKVPDDISEIFLLVSLNINAILQETTIHRRRQKLSAMADGLGLGDAYGATLGRIKGQGGERARLGMAALMWISHSEKPLKPDELCHALAVEIGSPSLNGDNVPSIGTLLACCQGLIVVNKEASTVRLIHFTLQEYLRAHPELFGTAHSTIAETCLSYLNSRQIRALSTNPNPDLRSTPFLEYSSLFWGIHAKRQLSDCTKSLALKMFDGYNNHVSTKILLKSQEPYFTIRSFDKPAQFSGLHCACIFGIVEIVASLIEVEGCDINQSDWTGSTPLLWAAWNGQEQVVKMLLGRGDISPDKPDMDGHTPLHGAAWNGHEGVVKMLLGRGDINPDQPNTNSKTPLCIAAENGHDGVVKILLGRDDVNPNESDVDGDTPLHGAARNAHEGVVKILLGRDDVNPNESNVNGNTPLHNAARNGHEGVVKILLGRDDVNPDESDVDGNTPLHCAAWNGHEGVVKMLLRRDDVNPNKLDVGGNTPLHCAARSEYEGVVKILLGRDDVNPNELDVGGYTPLQRAALVRHEGVVKILLGRDDVNPNGSGVCGTTPLHWAAWSGYEEMVKILLGRDDVNPNIIDVYGDTPLHHAALMGYEGMVKMLLGRGDIIPDKPDKNGRTPLDLATKQGHVGVVALLEHPRPPLPAPPQPEPV